MEWQEMLHPPSVTTSVDATSVRPTHLEPDSVFGIYLRELLLDFISMGFETVSSLFDDVVVYLKPEEEGMMGSGDDRHRPPNMRASSRQVQHYLQVGCLLRLLFPQCLAARPIIL